jgi:hypothetical protein
MLRMIGLALFFLFSLTAVRTDPCEPLIVFVLASAPAAFGQGHSTSHPGGPPSGMPSIGSGTGMGSGMGSGAGMGHASRTADNRGCVGQSQGIPQTQQPLRA